MSGSGKPPQEAGKAAVGTNLFIDFIKQLLVQTAELSRQCQDPVLIAVNPQFLGQPGSDLFSSRAEASGKCNDKSLHTILLSGNKPA